MTQFHWDPDTYCELMRREVPGYDELEDAVARATEGMDVHEVLDLGVGTGETATRVLAMHPHARLVGIDESAVMMARAREHLPEDAALFEARLQDELPAGPFDLVVSCLAVHHLNSAEKADLFKRVRRVLAQGGRFVLGDVVVPADPADAVAPIEEGYDLPDRAVDQLAWFMQAGLSLPHIAWSMRDLAVLVGDARD